MKQHTKLEPVKLSIDLACSPEHAYDTYTSQMGAWWPLDTHAVETNKIGTCTFEAREGGRIFEVTSQGTEHLWGTVLECIRPASLVHTWHPGGDPEKSTRVHIHFESLGDGCRLTLVHEGFEVLGERGSVVRDNYVPGWQFVIGECFKAGAEA